jgi:Uma2 family endonuclease
MKAETAEGRELRCFTADEVLRRVELGVLREDEPLELLDGVMVVVPAQGPLRSAQVFAVGRMLAAAYGSAWHVRYHAPLAVGPDSLPEPDLAVVRGVAEDYRERHPSGADAALVVAVALTSQRLDRSKTELFARAGVPVYWLLDLEARRVEERADQAPGNLYRVTTILVPEHEIAVPQTTERLPVKALLP